MVYKNYKKKADTSFEVPSLGDLSLSEIRSRLTSLGEGTSTPGLTGEERRAELMRRLVGAICGNGDTGDTETSEVLEDIMSTKRDTEADAHMNTEESVNEMPPRYVPPPPHDHQQVGLQNRRTLGRWHKRVIDTRNVLKRRASLWFLKRRSVR